MKYTRDDIEDIETGRREREFDAFLSIFCKRYGVKEDDIPKLIEHAKWSGEHRNSIHRVSWSAALGALGVFVTGLLLMIWEGVKHTVGRQ